MPNIEIKARCISLPEARIVARQIHTKDLGELHQIDTYFHTQSGRLKLREINGEKAELIPYFKNYNLGPMKSDYVVLPAPEPQALKDLLTKILGKAFVVDKLREVFLFENIRIHLDQVKGLGDFIEFEAVCGDDSKLELDRQSKKIQQLMQTFNIKTEDLLGRSYVDYLSEKSNLLSNQSELIMDSPRAE